MIEIEALLERLRDEGLRLCQAEHSSDPDVLHGLKGKKNQQHIERMTAVENLLAEYQLVFVADATEAARVAHKLAGDIAPLGLDIETAKLTDHPKAGLLPKLSSIRLVQLFDGETVWVVDCFATGGVEWIRPLQSRRMIAHNAAFEAAHFYRARIEFDTLDCSMLMGRVFLNRNISLADAAKDALVLDMDKALQVSDWNRPVLLPQQISYAAVDAIVALKLCESFGVWFKENPGYQRPYQFLQRLIYPIVRQQSHGISLDTVAHNQIVDHWRQQIAEAQAALAADGLTAPKSVKAKQAYLADRLTDSERAAWPKTKSGGLKTDRESLARATNHPTLGALAEFTTYSNRLANFGPKLRELMVEGALYPNYQIAGMVSGRFGCRDPNFQNQPRDDFKHVYLAPEGSQFVTGDLSQVELRVAGLISGDPVILEAYAKGKDLHRLMAMAMTGKPSEEISKAERTAAKAINFGLLFGSGATGLMNQAKASYGVEMSLEEAERAKSTFLRTYRVFAQWQRWIVEETNRQDFSDNTYSHLRRHYDERDHYSRGGYSDIYTHAMNYPIQSSAWEILALAIRYVDEHATDGIRVSHHVYDELTLVAPDSQVMNAGRLLRRAFEHGYQTVFPGCDVTGIVEVGAGRNWAEAGSDDHIIPV